MRRLLVIGWLVGLGCSEYEINEHQKPGLPGDEKEEFDPNDGTETDIPDDEDPVEVAEAPVYANTSTTLYEVEPDTGAHMWVGDFKESGQTIDKFVDIAIDSAGRMYGGTFDALYRIDPTTAEVFYICSANHDMTAMAFSSDGELFVGGAGSIHVMDITSCATEPLVDSTNYVTSGDLVGLPDGYLYWTVRGVDNDELVRVNPNNGATAWVGAIAESRLFGLGYANEQLFGFSSQGRVVRISPIGANSSVMVHNEELSWWGATTNPVTW